MRERQSDNESLTLHCKFPCHHADHVKPFGRLTAPIFSLGICRPLCFVLFSPPKWNPFQTSNGSQNPSCFAFSVTCGPFLAHYCVYFLEFFASIIGLLSLFTHVVAQVIETSTSLILRNN
jgi:hypothetical protein